MKKLTLAALTLMAAACSKDLPQNPAPVQIVARFDPSASPPIVPAPTDLAVDPTTGLLSVPVPSGASDIDLDFIAYLDTLNGFPSDTPGTATFTGALEPTSVTAATVKVLDVTAGYTAVTTTITYVDTGSADAPGEVVVAPPGTGWTAGHEYAIALVSGTAGLKGAKGEPVVGSAAWALVRSVKSLVTCTDLTSADCRSTTDLIPATTSAEDPTARLKEQGANAVALEQVRLHYKPVFDQLETLGVKRADVPLLFTFKAATNVQMLFNPATLQVPLPNDLAIDPTTGLVNAPIDPSAPAAQQEFTKTYLNTLNGFPAISPSTAGVINGDADPATVNASTVLVLDLNGDPLPDGGSAPVPATIAYVPSLHEVVVQPPAPGAWTKGHKYAVIVVGGENGVKTTTGAQIGPTDAFALARSPNSLVNADCNPADLTTCTGTLTVASLPIGQAVQLEQVRAAYAPLIAAVEANTGITYDQISILWTFSIVSSPEVTFNLATDATAAIPFPSSFIYEEDGGHVNLPPDPTNPFRDGLNTLDGFSTTAAIVTENRADLGALSDGAHIDSASLGPATLGFDDGGAPILGPLGAGLVSLVPGGAAPQYVACVNCASSLNVDGTTPTSPDQLQLVPQVPLAEKTPYAGFVTTAVKSTDGAAVIPTLQFALLRLHHPLFENGAPTVSGLTLAQAQTLEPIRAAYQPLFAALEAGGIDRQTLALAWSFKTQTAHAALVGLYGYPTQLDASSPSGTHILPSTPTYLVGGTLPIAGGLVETNLLAALPAPLKSDIGHAYFGGLSTPFALTGTGGTFDLAHPDVATVGFTLVVPKASLHTMPANGWPVVVFGHGLTRNRNDMLAIANAFASAGIASIGTDVVWHGDRTTCVGAAQVVAALGGQDDNACANPTTMKCDEDAASPSYGRCITRTPNATSPTAGTFTDACGNTPGGLLPHGSGDLWCRANPAHGDEGYCVHHDPADETTWKCAGGDFKRDANAAPVISGWNILNLSNLFATRDNFRQQVIDEAQLIRVISEPTATTGSLNATLTAEGGGKLDATSIHYTGQSLGGILGTLVTSASPEIHHAVLNVPGGDFITLLLTSPSFADVKAAFLGALAAQGLVPGTPSFDQFLGVADWILDPADPRNAANFLSPGTEAVPDDRAVLVQYIDQDQVVPDGNALELLASANRPLAVPQADVHFYKPTTTNPTDQFGLDFGNRHGFLLNFTNQNITAAAQLDAVTYVATGSSTCNATICTVEVSP
jgi:hypothetical protein